MEEKGKLAPGTFRLSKAETLPLTRELVAEMRALPPSPTERDISQKRVDFLRERLKAGLFHPPQWVKAVIVNGNGEPVTYRANGQHTSNMLSHLDGEFPQGMMVHLSTFDCADTSALALLFRQFDERKSSRSPADVSGAYQGLETPLDEVPRHLGKLAIEGIIWYRKNVMQRDQVPVGDDRYALFHDTDQHPFLQWYGGLFPMGRVREVMNQPIVGAMYATYNLDADAADDFWREVIAGGKEYEETAPTTILYDWLVRVYKGEWNDIKPKQFYQGAVFAWNAARDGKEIRDIRSDIKKSLLTVR